jgi:hypothetical protein
LLRSSRVICQGFALLQATRPPLLDIEFLGRERALSDQMPFLTGARSQTIAAIRSSITSRSTSQNLSDDRTSLSISSVWADSSSSIISGGDARKFLLHFLGLRPSFDFCHLARFDLAAPLNDSSPLISPFLL